MKSTFSQDLLCEPCKVFRVNMEICCESLNCTRLLRKTFVYKDIINVALNIFDYESLFLRAFLGYKWSLCVRMYTYYITRMNLD